MQMFYNNKFDDGKVQKDYIGKCSLFKFCVSKNLGFKNKTLIKINYSYLLITFGLVQINYIVVNTYEIHSMLVACYGLVHDDFTICTLHVTGVGTRQLYQMYIQ